MQLAVRACNSRCGGATRDALRTGTARSLDERVRGSSVGRMDACAAALDAAAATSHFAGVVTVHHLGQLVFEKAYGHADRAHGIPHTVRTRFALASGAKAFTALTAVRLVEAGVLELHAPVRQWLGKDLPLIDSRVTLEHLLAHTSGIGDYLDESDGADITDHVMTVPVHTLDTTAGFLPALDGHPQVSEPGAQFAYNNAGYVVLALIAERASGVGFHELVRREVFDRAGMADTAYLRMDQLPGDTAQGYLFVDSDAPEALRTNALHLPVRGSGDGGAFSTAADLALFWAALMAGRIVSAESLAAMTRPRGDVLDEGKRYGMGFWIAGVSADATGTQGEPAVVIEGYDAGVSMRSTCNPATGDVFTVLSNWSDGAWAVGEVVDGWV